MRLKLAWANVTKDIEYPFYLCKMGPDLFASIRKVVLPTDAPFAALFDDLTVCEAETLEVVKSVCIGGPRIPQLFQLIGVGAFMVVQVDDDLQDPFARL